MTPQVLVGPLAHPGIEKIRFPDYVLTGKQFLGLGSFGIKHMDGGHVRQG